MKIEWLNNELTEAFVIKGWFRKRRAHVQRTEFYGPVWKFVPSGNEIHGGLHRALNRARKAEEQQRSFNRDWQPVDPMPRARLLRGDS